MGLQELIDVPDIPDYDKKDVGSISIEPNVDFNYPGTEMMFKFSGFFDFDILLQLIIFLIFIIFIFSVSIVMKEWKHIRTFSKLVPESVMLLVVGSLLGWLGNAVSPTVYNYLPDLHTLRVNHLN